MDLQKSPCYGCTKRESGCHATCKEYAEWAKMKKEANETLKKKMHIFQTFQSLKPGKFVMTEN